MSRVHPESPPSVLPLVPVVAVVAVVAFAVDALVLFWLVADPCKGRHGQSAAATNRIRNAETIAFLVIATSRSDALYVVCQWQLCRSRLVASLTRIRHVNL